MDSVTGQHVSLTFSSRRAVAAHRRKYKRRGAVRPPVVHHRPDDGGEVGDAPAPHADGYSGAGFHTIGKALLRELPDCFSWDIRKRTVREMLPD